MSIVNFCPECKEITFYPGLCGRCDDIAKKAGLDNKEFIDRLPKSERLIVMLPMAQDMAARLQNRPLINHKQMEVR